MRLTFLGKDSVPDQSPTLYATDRDSYVVQGWVVTEPEVFARLELSDSETVVEVPPGLLRHLAKDGLDGAVKHLEAPIVRVLGNGNYLIQGQRVHDAEALGQMDLPAHETCVEVPRSTVAALLIGG